MLRDWRTPSGAAPAATRADPATGVERADWAAADLERIVSRLRSRGRAALAAVPVERRLAAWCAAIEDLLDPESDERRRLLPRLVVTSGLSAEGLSEGLEIVLGGVGPGPADRLAARARGVDAPREPAGVVVAANLPALAAQSLLPALLLGRPLLIRSSTREPLFAPALVAALAGREPALGDAFAALTWPADDEAATAAALAPLGRVLAYGGEPAIARLGERLGDRLVAFGPRASVALVAGPVDPLATARAVARDVARFDQRGCLSVHSVWVVGPAGELAEALAYALAFEARRLPPGPVDPAVASAAQQLRGVAALSGRLVGRLELGEGTVVVDPEARFRPSPGARVVRVHEVASLDAAIAALEAERGRLQGAALAGEAALARAEEIARRLGLARAAPAGELQNVEAGAATGGLDPFPYLAGDPSGSEPA